MTKTSTARPETPLLHGLLVYRVLSRPLMSAGETGAGPRGVHGAAENRESRAESKELVTQEEGHAGSAMLVRREKDDAESEALE